MVAIVSGVRLGLDLGSLQTLGASGGFGNAAEGRNRQGVYVNLTNANLVVQNRDDLLVGRGEDASVLRTYNSRGYQQDDNGDNWSNGSMALRLHGTLNAAGSSMWRLGGDGSIGVYVFDAARTAYVSTDGAGAYDTITYVPASGQFEWRDGDTGATQTFEGGGAMRLLAGSDRSGNTLTYAYGANGQLSSVTTGSGEATVYDYTANNLTQVRTVSPEGMSTRVRYGYDASNRLTSVTVDLTPEDDVDDKTYQTTYAYEGTSTRLASITQTDGSRLAFTYTDIGGGSFLLKTVTDALNQTMSFAYTLTTSGVVQAAAVTDAQGFVTRYDFDAASQLTTITSPGGAAPARQFTYTATGDVASVADAEGRTVAFQYDANGNQVLQRDLAGNTVTRTFDARNQLVTESTYAVPDPDGAGAAQPASPFTTRYVYDASARNLLRFVVSAEGRVTEHRYNGFGERTSTITYAAGSYSVAGLAPTATLSEFQMMAWASTQDLAATQRADMAYDGRGQLQARTTYATVAATGEGVADGTQSVQKYVYDRAGHLLQAVSPTNGITTFTYDGFGRVLTQTDAAGQVTVTRYSDAAAKTSITLDNGLVTTSSHDAAGRLVSVLKSTAAAADLGETRYFYDSLGRLRMTQDATGARSWMLYDALGRRVADIDGNGSLTEHLYDRSDRVTGSIAYLTAVNTAALTDAGGAPLLAVTLAGVRPAAAAGDVQEWRAYDAAGRLVKTATSVGSAAAAAVTEFRYDGASRLVQRTEYANIVATTAGAIAPGTIPTPAPSAQDRVTRNFYGADGTLAGTLDAEGYLTIFTYNGAGQEIRRLAFATATDPALRANGTLAQLQPAAADADIATWSFYNAKGQLTGQVDGESYLTETLYDANGNVAQSVRYASRVAGPVTVDSTVAALRPPSDAADRSTLRSYDAQNRLTQEISPEGVVTQHTYDNVGQLVSTVRAAGSGESRTVLARYDVLGRLVGELSAEGAERITPALTQAQVDAIWTQYGQTHAYDAAGRRTSTTDPLGNSTWFYYNADNALTYTINALGEVRENRYDAQGRLTQQVAYANRTALRGPGGLLDSPLSLTADATRDSVTTTTYTRDGQIATTSDAELNVTSRSYNAFGEEIASNRTLSAGVTLSQTHTLDRRGLRTGSVLDAASVNAVLTTTYDAFGRAIRTVDANGNVREQSFDRLGRVVAMRDPMGSLRSTSYDAFARQLSQTDALGNVTSYAYDTAARSMSVTTAEGVRTTTTYTRDGQVLSVTDGKGLVTSYSYDREGHLLRTATPLGDVWNAYDRMGNLVETTDAGGNKVSYTYDAARRVLSRSVDPAGLNLTTSYQYDGKGQRVLVVDPNGGTAAFRYDRLGRVLTHTVDPSGLNLQTVYAYDADGRVLTVTSPAGRVTRYVYDALGRRTQERVDPAGLNLLRTWSYDKNGNVTSGTDARGNTTRHAYDAADRLVFTLDPLGNLKEQAYDAQGRLVKSVAYAASISTIGLGTAPGLADIQPRIVRQPAQDVIEQRVYDKEDRLAATVDGTGAVVRYGYDGNGNVVSRVAFAGRIDLSAWTAGSLPDPAPEPARDSRTTTVYDALERAVYSMDGIGSVVWQGYDGNGNVVERVAYATGIPTDTAPTEAAMAAAVALIADPARDTHVRNTFDAANRLTYSVDGAGTVTRHVYDGNGNTVQDISYATPIAAGAAAASVAASAGDRITSRAFDKAGRLVFSIDALKAVTEQAWDADGNVVRRIAYETPLGTLPALGTSGTVDAIRTAVKTGALDRSTHFGYDAAGRQTLAIDAGGAASEMQYDAAGNLTARISYAIPVDASALASTAPLASLRTLVVANAADRATQYAYDAAGRRVYETDPLNAVKQIRYDGVGQVIGTRRYLLAIAPGTPNTASAIAAAVITDASDRWEEYSYNAGGQRTVTRFALGGTESCAYDALGHKLSFTNRKGAVWTYSYDAAGRMISETSPEVTLTTTTFDGDAVLEGAALTGRAVTTLAYDALGNLIRRTEARGRPEQRTTHYEYDQLGRQVRVIFPPVGVYDQAGDNPTGSDGISPRKEISKALETRTYYDAFGNAVANRDVGGALSQKVYDRLGRVLYEIDALGYVTGYGYDAFGGATSLTRYGSGTSLAARSVSQASQAATQAAVEAALASPVFNHGADRTLRTTYDQAGRVWEVSQPQAFAYDSGTGAAFTGSARSRKIYNAFGEVVQESQSRDQAGSSWITTTHYFDAAGRERAAVDAMGYLTECGVDALGNLTLVTEHAMALAAGAWTVNSYAAPAASSDNRVVRYTYDALDRKTSETRMQVEYGTDPAAPRGNLLTQYGYDAVGNQTSSTDATGQTTWTYYDALGRITAVATPLTGATKMVTEFRRDAHGNVLATVEHATGTTANATGFTPIGDADGDRVTLARYDVLGRAVETRDGNGATAFASFDAWGHVAKSWRGVTDVDGRTRTQFKVNVFDALGQLVETRTPASTTVVQEGVKAAYVAATYSIEDSSLLAPNKVTLEWSSLLDPAGGTVRVEVDYVTPSTVITDEYGTPVMGEPAHVATVSQDMALSAAMSGAQVTWTQATERVAYMRVYQLAAGQWRARWEGSLANATGSGVSVLAQAEAGVVLTNQEFNAFGERTRKGTQGGRQEYFEFDNAGRLWRTNSGDGIDKIRLYDLQGNATAEIRSSGSGRDDRDVKTFVNAEAAHADGYTRRVDTQYNALGRITARTEAARLEAQGGVSVQRQFTTAGVQSAVPVGDLQTVSAWTGQNTITLGWNSLGSLGSGDVKVTVTYRTPVTRHVGQMTEYGFQEPDWFTGGFARTFSSSIINGDAAATGTVLSWAETSSSPDAGGVGSVTWINVQKKDMNGTWQTVIDQVPGYGGNEIDVAAPTDSQSGVVLQIRRAGAATFTTVSSAELVNFGKSYRYDARALGAGSYEYQVIVAPAGQAQTTLATGAVTITLPPLNAITTPIAYGAMGAGVLAWLHQDFGVQQVFRYRLAGSTQAWATLPVTIRSDGAYDGVDTSSLTGGTFEYELLWSTDGQGVPTAHATGTFNFVPAVPAYFVPAVGTPNIVGIQLGTLQLPGTYTSYSDSDSSYVPGPTVTALQWVACDATIARYRVAGGAWSNLTIDNALQSTEMGVLQGYQRAALNGLGVGTYEIEILTSTGVIQRGTATYTVYPQDPPTLVTTWVEKPVYAPRVAYYEPIYETRTGYTEVQYWAHVTDYWYISGYNENGDPIWTEVWHDELRTRYDPYEYQVQVGQYPVYAYDENGNVIYDVVGYTTEAVYTWVPGATPAPTLAVTTPPFTPEYWVSEAPAQYSSAPSAAPGSYAISGTDGSGMTQAAGALNGGSQWLRPTVRQNTDRWGNVVFITDPRSTAWVTTYRYNANNQMVLQTQPSAAGAPQTQVFYDALGRQIALRDANGNVNSQVFDAGGHLVEERHADGGIVRHTYDALGRRTATVDAEGNTVGFSYDRMGHLLAVDKGLLYVYGSGGTTAVQRNVRDEWTYDQLGQKTSFRNGNGEVLKYVYDLRGNVVETRQPMGETTRSAFDANGRKIGELDANNFSSYWSYDYFGQLTAHRDLGGASYAYGYDNARQLIAQSNTRGQSLSYGFDAAGQLTRIADAATHKVSTFMYDAGGRKIRETVIQDGITYQDNHLGYDALGNLRDVADARVHIGMTYDGVGNRTSVQSSVNYQGTSGEVTSGSARFFRYDAMNRQVLVDAVNAAGDIGAQGHEITYDRNGNRKSDRHAGTRVATTSGVSQITGFHADGTAIYSVADTTYTKTIGTYTTETYQYDAINRLRSVERDGVQVDHRRYDAADRLVQSGSTSLPAGYRAAVRSDLAPEQSDGLEIRRNRYDANGRMLHQSVLDGDLTGKTEISWDPNENIGTNANFIADGYDQVGNAKGYVVLDAKSGALTKFSTTFLRFEGHQAAFTAGQSTQVWPGSNTQGYDANGFLVSVTDATLAANDKRLVNDAQGRALFVEQAGHVERQLIVDGEVLGVYGVGVDMAQPKDGNNNPNFTDIVDLDFGYAPITSTYPNASPGIYVVRTGDTLQGIAQSAYGDSSLWFRIAEANGVLTTNDLKVGQTLNIPNRVSTIHNDNTTFKPFDPSRINGDMTPNLPMPVEEDGCGGMGKVLMIVVAVIVTIYTAGAMSSALGTVTSTSAGAAGTAGAAGAGIGAAAGAGAGGAASATAGGFGLSFTAELAALSGSTVGNVSVTAGLSSAGAANVVSAAVGAAVGSVAGQGVGIAAGVLEDFDWRGVGMSALSAGITSGLGTAFATPARTLSMSTSAVVGRSMLSNFLTQGVGVALGLQRKFDWRGVAASGLGAAVVNEVVPALSGALGGDGFGPRLAVGLLAGAVTSVARAGRMQIQKVVVDAFGNALGQSIAGASNSAPTTPAPSGSDDALGEFIAKNGNWAHVDIGPIPALVNGMTFSETVAAGRQVSDPLGIRAMASDSASVLRRADALWGPKPEAVLSDSSTDSDVAAQQMRDAGYEGNMVLAGGASVRVTPGTGVRPPMVNGISVNQKAEAAFQFADDLAGMTGLYRDYKLLGGLMSELQQKTTLERLQGALQEKLGMMRVMPTPHDLGAVPGIGGADGGIRYNNADLIDRYSDALRKVEMWKQGIIDLDTKSMLITSIGNQRMSPAQWVEENTQRYQRAFAAGVEEGRQKYINGQLRYPVDMPQQLQVGLYGHRFAELEIVSYNRSLGVPEGPGQLLSMNRWSYDPSGSGMTVRADMLLDLGPNRGNQGLRFVVDGKSSVTEAMASGAQFARTSNWLGGASVKAATPQGLLPWIPRRGR